MPKKAVTRELLSFILRSKRDISEEAVSVRTGWSECDRKRGLADTYTP